MEERVLTDQELVRREKLEKLRAQGIDPFGHRFERTNLSSDIKRIYGGKTHDELAEMKAIEVIAGRVMTVRNMGKVAFVTLQDLGGFIQVYIRKDTIGEDVYDNVFKLVDIGDFIGIKGEVMLTKTGEITIKALEYTHLSKALRPLPEKFHGLVDVEERYRRRYVDLIMNEDAKRIATLRPKIIRSIQRYMDGLGYMEVETPVLHPILGGAAARPFVTHHNTLDMDFYLRIATELPLKRLLVGGLEKVYEIGRLFRNEGMDTRHNPEFTTIEAYQAYGDLDTMMDLVEGVFSNVSKDVLGTQQVEKDGVMLDLKGPFRRISMAEFVKQETGIDFTKIYDLEEAKKLAKEHHIEVETHHTGVGHILNLFFEEYCEKKCVQPTFVTGHPIEISPLAKKDPKDPRYTLRFELFICGSEYANAFTELNDPIDQRERFENQLKERELGNDEANQMDVDFVEALEYGMPPAGGVGIGIDRFVMLLCGTNSIREVLLFPHMRNLDNKQNKKEVSKVEVSAKEEPVTVKEEVIDFSNVEIEPLFKDFVDFETFSKSDFRAVKVKECSAVAKSKKLLKFVLDDGSGVDRVILSGIHDYYEPEDLVGKTLIAITNLPPRKMMGIDSCGMIISAVHHENGIEKLHCLMVDSHIPAGAKLY
ncbi:MAG: lysine--tRNA ligase [Bacilli bacterium]|nr:lysine--tRNA ligase [Bacilli bacterium]